MCLYPILIKNPRYKSTKKNKGKIPECTDERTKFVPIGCGNCIECRRQKANGWRVRLTQEMRTNPQCYFVTLTFNNEAIDEIAAKWNVQESNALATIAVRKFLERVRKDTKKSVKHWLITELGGENERIHLHGFIWSDNIKRIMEKWNYGFYYIGKYCNDKTINYCVKYVMKTDEKHKNFKPVILCSKGIGGDVNLQRCKFNGDKTNENFRLPNGRLTALPIYYRNKVYNETERQILWTQRLDKQERFVLGTRISIKDGDEEYYRQLKGAQEFNKRLGFGDNSDEWKKEPYNVKFTDLQRITRIKKEEERRKKVRESIKVILK